MKIKSTIILFCLLVAGQLITKAQSTMPEIIKEWERAKAYTKEYLDAMPESGYALNPTPERRSFADQMLHLADGNFAFATAATGVKSPYPQGGMEKSTDKSKAAVSKLVLESYDFIINNAKNISSEQLGENQDVWQF